MPLKFGMQVYAMGPENKQQPIHLWRVHATGRCPQFHDSSKGCRLVPRLMFGSNVDALSPEILPEDAALHWSFQKLGASFWESLHKKDHSMFGSILGAPCLWKLPHRPEYTTIARGSHPKPARDVFLSIYRVLQLLETTRHAIREPAGQYLVRAK